MCLASAAKAISSSSTVRNARRAEVRAITLTCSRTNYNAKSKNALMPAFQMLLFPSKTVFNWAKTKIWWMKAIKRLSMIIKLNCAAERMKLEDFWTRSQLTYSAFKRSSKTRNLSRKVSKKTSQLFKAHPWLKLGHSKIQASSLFRKTPFWQELTETRFHWRVRRYQESRQVKSTMFQLTLRLQIRLAATLLFCSISKQMVKSLEKKLRVTS